MTLSKRCVRIELRRQRVELTQVTLVSKQLVVQSTHSSTRLLPFYYFQLRICTTEHKNVFFEVSRLCVNVLACIRSFSTDIKSLHNSSNWEITISSSCLKLILRSISKYRGAMRLKSRVNCVPFTLNAIKDFNDGSQLMPWAYSLQNPEIVMICADGPMPFEVYPSLAKKALEWHRSVIAYHHDFGIFEGICPWHQRRAIVEIFDSDQGERYAVDAWL